MEEKIAGRQRYFHQTLAAAFLECTVEKGCLLELGSGTGDLLAALHPQNGIGIDFSPQMIRIAEGRHNTPNLQFLVKDARYFEPDSSPSVVVADYLLNYLADVQSTLTLVHKYLDPDTGLLVLSIQNTLWRPIISFGRALRLTHKGIPHSWISSHDVQNFLQLSKFEAIQQREEILWPFRTPFVDWLCNRFLARLPLLRHLSAVILFTARPISMDPGSRANPVRISLIVPARNESGHLRELLPRIPKPTPNIEIEVVLIEGNSTDDTWDVIEEIAASEDATHFHIQTLRQSGKGKWNAVQEGIAAATGEICIIQDADLTAPPEDLSKFFEVLTTDGYRFASGSRLVYPMEEDAMKWLNLLGNRFFAALVSFIIRRPVKDSLCGTKAFYKSDFTRMKERLPEIYHADPFGDFFLFFGASALQLRSAEIPIRYRARTYGETNISRWRDARKLLRLCWIGALRLRFPPITRKHSRSQNENAP